jgi:hypothetical protein
MTLRAVYLSAGMIAATALWGFSVYSADAISGKVPVDGYGITLAVRP